MRLAEGIRRHGFRKWYERELMRSHLHMLLLLFCAIGLLGAFELFSRTAPLSEQLNAMFSVLLCAGVGVWSLRRYLYLLMHAEEVAHQAVCAQCKAYGRLAVLQVEAASERVSVRCKQCGHSWPIDG